MTASTWSLRSARRRHTATGYTAGLPAAGVTRYGRQNGSVVQSFTGEPVQLLNTPPRDSVSDMLTALTVQSSVYCLSELRAPWGFEVGGANVAKFHLVLEGECWLHAESVSPLRLSAGDLVILSRGERHMMRDEMGSPVVGLDELIDRHPLDDQ